MKKQASLTALALATALTATTAQAGNIKTSGKVFFDYSKHSTTGAADTTGGTISRTYITAEKKINRVWSAKVTLDSSYDGATGKSNNVFLKKAQLTGKFSQARVRLGMIDTPWVGYEDKMNKHRYISKSFVDRLGLAASADAGIGVQGKFNIVSYDIASLNGAGYSDTKVTAKTDLEARFSVKPKAVKGLEVNLGYRTGYLGKYIAGATEKKNTLTQLLVSYSGRADNVYYRVAANAITNKVDDQIANITTDQKGTEIWATARSGKYGGYIRSESFDNGVPGSAKETRTLLSLDYYATKGVLFSLVSDTTSDVNGVAGISNSTTGVFSQFKF